ncbi:ABC transporter ATP-binding protein [Imhoffiella purpurea]|uniref:ABC-type dipeptide transporter n=1 Tax=Imhoffiella purpurea TaxID=1249627 RepID=W9W1Q6_9GAMM|nr:ABC transporter ATP-binding protein [Imhoffiella purpurea]EXJ16540.1 Dipeptide transport ATP-binding protein DppF [Imhoffiella purpurea]
MTEPLLQVEGLITELGETARPLRVVDGLDLTIRSGETFALLGESGCGKSMAALSLMRLLPPGGRILSGRVRLGGTDLLHLTEAEMRSVRGGRMAMIFQEPQTSLNPVLSVGVQIAEALHVHGEGSDGRNRRRVVELLRAVGIPDPEQRADEYPHQLSGGMKQRVMIAMALAGDPGLLIADEPTTALDVTIQAQVLSLLGDLRRETGMAVLLITHDLGVVAETADRLAVMYAGQIVETATVSEFFAGPAHPYGRMLMESLPSAEKRRGRLATIPGRVPPLDRVFSGCRFADRCASVMPLCRERIPEWIGLGAGRGVRCHLWSEGEASHPGPARNAAEPESGASERPSGSVGEIGSPLLKAVDLKVHFPIQRGLFRRVVGHVRAVDGVSLDLSLGRTLALVGESGCGKTTVGKAILQLIAPTSGQVLYLGRNLAGLGHRAMRPYRKDLQIVFQDPYASMNPRMLVGDVVGEGLQALGIEWTRAVRERRVADLLELVGMDPESARRYPHEFSGGQRQRICIARALAVEPRIIVCDEPTSALDVSVQAQILNLLKDLQSRLGLAYLFITHNISVVSYLAHEVAVMYLGRVVERGGVEEILTDPRHPYTRALLSAVPVVDPEKRRVVIRLEGDMPSPSNPPRGCHFHPRCPEATSRCSEGYPPEVRLGASRYVSCLHLD